MRAGRKNLKKASTGKDCLSLLGGQSIMEVISLRGSNIIEVRDAKGVKTLAMFPAKFQKSIWIKRGSFVVVDESGREQALESGGKVTCMVLQVLFHQQVRALQRSSEWPEIFKTACEDDSEAQSQGPMAEPNAESDYDSEDGLPPPEANANRNRPVELSSGSDTMAEPNAESDYDSEDGLPPLEANANRNRPVELSLGSDTEDPD